MPTQNQYPIVMTKDWLERAIRVAESFGVDVLDLVPRRNASGPVCDATCRDEAGRWMCAHVYIEGYEPKATL